MTHCQAVKINTLHVKEWGLCSPDFIVRIRSQTRRKAIAAMQREARGATRVWLQFHLRFLLGRPWEHDSSIPAASLGHQGPWSLWVCLSFHHCWVTLIQVFIFRALGIHVLLCHHLQQCSSTGEGKAASEPTDSSRSQSVWCDPGTRRYTLLVNTSPLACLRAYNSRPPIAGSWEPPGC